MRAYVALISKEPNTEYWVDFPDFPGCVSAGKTMKAAVENAHEALAMHTALMAKDGDRLPDPTPIEKITANPDNEGAVPFLVSVSSPKPKALKINITIPENVMDEIDAITWKTGESRSGFLTQAAREYLNKFTAKIKPDAKKRRTARKRKAVA